MRHLLIGIIVAIGLGVVGSQLKKQRLVIEAVDAENVLSDDLRSIVRRVDEEFEDRWKATSLVPADQAANLLVARRLSLALTGTIPSLEEIRAFESIDSDEQLPWWLDRLLSDRRYSDYLGERLARAYVGTEGGPFIVFRRRRFVSWLSDCLHANQPYDEIVRSLISDRGLWTDKPAVNFVTVTVGSDEEEQPDEERLAARTTRAFLGVRLDCMQCHDDNLAGQWLQSDFHGLAAYFSEARNSGLGIHDSQRPYTYKYLGEPEEDVVEPKVPFASELVTEGESRRDELARWVTHPGNKAFARATVNRVWALLFGKPLVEPIDSIPLEGPYPPGLKLLADDLAEHGFDLRRLIAAIASTRVFRQASRADHEVTQQHESEWAVFPLTRLRPEQVAGGIVQSASLPTIDSDSHILVRLARFDQIDNFVKRYGDTGEDEFAAHGGTIPQRLVMLNGDLVKERTKDDAWANAATRVAQQVADDRQAIEAAYLIVLSRPPTEPESTHFVKFLGDDRAHRKQRMEDVFWSLLNSTEFSWNH